MLLKVEIIECELVTLLDYEIISIFFKHPVLKKHLGQNIPKNYT